jgi:hypothetical protein
MTTVNTGRSTRSRRRVHAAVETAGAATMRIGCCQMTLTRSLHTTRDVQFRNGFRASRPARTPASQSDLTLASAEA